MTILVLCKLLVGCRALQLILQTGHHRKSFFILLITMAFLQIVDAADAVSGAQGIAEMTLGSIDAAAAVIVGDTCVS
jgi:hypothetical protein